MKIQCVLWIADKVYQKTCLFSVYKKGAWTPPPHRPRTRPPASSTYRNTKTPSDTISRPLFLHSLSCTKPTRSCRRRSAVLNWGGGAILLEIYKKFRQADCNVGIWSHFTCHCCCAVYLPDRSVPSAVVLHSKKKKKNTHHILSRSFHLLLSVS